MKSIQWNKSFIGWEWIAICSVFTLLVLLYLEVRKKRKKRLTLRLVLLACMVLSLALVALQPAWKLDQQPISAVLLTAEYNPRVLDSLHNSTQNALKVFIHGDGTNQLNYSSVSGIEQIAAQYPEVEQLFVLGNPSIVLETDLPSSLKITPLLNQVPDGISEVEFPDEVNINETIQISGKMRTNYDTTVHLTLIAPHGKVDSISLNQGISSFSLTTNPKLAGKFLYTLLKKKPGTNYEKKYILPIVVKPFVPLNIVIRTNAPDFEIRSLKNWLGETGHKLAVQSWISKAVYHQEFINQENIFSAELSKENLAKLDVLIIEGAALSTLSQSNLSTLTKAISEQGLAMIVLGDQEAINQKNGILRQFLDFEIESADREEQVLKQIINGKNIQAEIKKLPFKLLDKPNVESHFEGLYASRNLGTGKVGLLLSTATYTLNLGGENDFYSHYWSEVINKVLPNHNFETAWKLSEHLNFVNSEVNLKLMNYRGMPDVYVSDEDSTAVALPMLQDPNFSDQWHGKFWPAAEGWHRLFLNDSNGETDDQELEKWFYIQHDSTWKTLLHSQAAERIQAYTKNRNYSAETANKSPLYFYEPIDKVYFFAIFLLSCGLLWIEQKL